ncbi:MAG: DUF1289 domain-containing protein [Terriglobales bacterium]
MGTCRAPERICLGCGRTTEEIAAWGALDEAERQRIMREVLPGRCARLAGTHRPLAGNRCGEPWHDPWP